MIKKKPLKISTWSFFRSVFESYFEKRLDNTEKNLDIPWKLNEWIPNMTGNGTCIWVFPKIGGVSPQNGWLIIYNGKPY